MKALITGASSGIGLSMARYFDELGYELVLVTRDKKKLDSVLEKEYEEVKNILDYIDKNEGLKQRFKELYDSNRYLLDDEEELKRRIDKLLADNSYILNSAQKAVDSAKVKQYKKF